MRTHYEVLGVEPDIGPDELRKAWTAMARRHHPDRGGDPARMREVNEAWAVLADPPSRRAYDRSLGAPPEPPRPRVAPGFVEEDFDDDDDTTFVARPMRAPAPGLALVPPGLFVASIFIACFALVLDEPAVLGVAGMVFFISCVAVAAVALLSLRATKPARRRH